MGKISAALFRRALEAIRKLMCTEIGFHEMYDKEHRFIRVKSKHSTPVKRTVVSGSMGRELPPTLAPKKDN